MKNKISLIILLLILFLTSCALDVESDKKVTVNDNTYQFSTKANLLNNEYFKPYTLFELSEKGDFGIGTLNGVDGELIILDGSFYQVKYSGKVEQPYKSSLSPFANIKFFNEDISEEIKNFDKGAALNILKFKNTSDKIAAIKISGSFSFVTARSVKKVETTDKSLDYIIQNQAVFNFDKVSGTMVGYYIPQSYDTECFTGFHFHFISDNYQLGGHVLDFYIDSAKAFIDFSDSLKLIN